MAGESALYGHPQSIAAESKEAAVEAAPRAPTVWDKMYPTSAPPAPKEPAKASPPKAPPAPPEAQPQPPPPAQPSPTPAATPEETYAARVDGWLQQTLADPEVGPESVRQVAQEAVDQYGTEKLHEVLATGIGNHPEVVRLVARMAKRIRSLENAQRRR